VNSITIVARSTSCSRAPVPAALALAIAVQCLLSWYNLAMLVLQ